MVGSVSFRHPSPSIPDAKRGLRPRWEEWDGRESDGMRMERLLRSPIILSLHPLLIPSLASLIPPHVTSLLPSFYLPSSTFVLRTGVAGWTRWVNDGSDVRTEEPTWRGTARISFTPHVAPCPFALSSFSLRDTSRGRHVKEMQRLDWSLSRKVTQDIKTQPQINHYQSNLTS